MTVMNSINKSKNIFTVIDVGNSKVSCLIGTSVKTNDVQIKSFRFWTTCLLLVFVMVM